MAIELTAVQKAQAAAAEATAAAQRAQDAAQVEKFDAVTNVKELNGLTDFQSRQNKSRYISLFGLDRWISLVANSR